MSLFLVDNVFQRLFIAQTIGCIGRNYSVIVSALVELFVNGHFHIAQAEYQVLAFARSKFKFYVMRRNGRPTLRNRIVRLALENGVGTFKSVVKSEKTLAVSIKALNIRVYGIEREMVAAFLVFGLVINC